MQALQMPVIESRHNRVFKELVAARRQQLLEALVSTPDPRIAGLVQGLDEAVKIADEADYKLNGGS